MPIKSIIIDNKQTTAKRIAPDKVQLDLVALPLDEQNDAEPNLDIRLYINGQLLQNLQSSADGVIKENIVIDSSDVEQLTITLEEVTQGVKSKIKYILIEEMEENNSQNQEKKESLLISLYNLNKEILIKFSPIDLYFQEIIKSEDRFDKEFIYQEFKKIENLGKLKYKLETIAKIDLLSPYKQELKDRIDYCYTKMTINEIDFFLKNIEIEKNNLHIKSNEEEILNNKENISDYEGYIDSEEENISRYTIKKRTSHNKESIERYEQNIEKSRNYKKNCRKDINNFKEENEQLQKEIEQLKNENKQLKK